MFNLIENESSPISHVELTLQIIILTTVVIIIFTIILFFIVIALRIKSVKKYKYWKKLENKWDKLIFEIMGGYLNREIIFASISRKERLYFIQYLLRFSQRVRGEEFDQIKLMAKPYLPLLLRKVKKGAPEYRARAVMTLGVLGFPEYIPTVIEALNDNSPMVSMLAARTLANKTYPNNIRFILPVILQTLPDTLC